MVYRLFMQRGFGFGCWWMCVWLLNGFLRFGWGGMSVSSRRLMLLIVRERWCDFGRKFGLKWIVLLGTFVLQGISCYALNKFYFWLESKVRK